MPYAAPGLAAFALAISALSLIGAFAPAKLVNFVRDAISSWGFPVAIVGRLALAALFWASAPISHTPLVFQALAALTLLGALVIFVAGRERMVRFIDYFARLPTSAMRLWCCVGVLFGVFLLWSLSASWSAT